MSKSNAFEADLVTFIFHGTAIAALSGITTLYVSLHTADPGETGTQATSEAAYGSYARMGISRTAGLWTITANSVSPVSAIAFPECTSGSETETYAGVGTAASGAGYLIYSGALSPTIAVSTGVTPRIKTDTTITED